jgi:hypothetical protein
VTRGLGGCNDVSNLAFAVRSLQGSIRDADIRQAWRVSRARYDHHSDLGAGRLPEPNPQSPWERFQSGEDNGSDTL